jgi:hypothetical protein
MTDKPILFSTPMVRALLRGDKTQTRRVLSLRGFRDFSEFGPSDTPGYDWHFRRADGCWCDFTAADLPLAYTIGDRLWVKETWFFQNVDGADCTTERLAAGQSKPAIGYIADGIGFGGQRKKPSIFMPRWASRLTLTVTDVRAERLQDISEEDAIAEGIEPLTGSEGPNHYTIHIPGFGSFNAPTAKETFQMLWCYINGPDAWEANPWVVALTFDVDQRNIDQ